MILSANAKPYAFSFDPAKTALLLSSFTSRTCFFMTYVDTIMSLISLLVDFQRDFIEEGGFGEIQGGNLAAVQAAVKPAAALLRLARKAGLTVVHTREGHEPRLRDCPTCKVRLCSFPSDRRERIFMPAAYTPSQCSKLKAHCGNRGTRPKG